MILPVEHPSVHEAPILHIDLDAYFASVEILDDPSLAGKPVAVGGAGARSVIASASYEARRFGVKSAMPSLLAQRLCPNLIILPGRFDRYEYYSQRFHDIINDLTPDYEPLGLDEVFCDLRSLALINPDPIASAWALKRRIFDELGLLSGVGLGRNKLWAKLASKRSKPRVVNAKLVDGPGVLWVDEQMESKWLEELPVRALWGVGPATAAKLEKLGIHYVRELSRVGEDTLAAHVGPAMARSLADYATGDDERPVEVNRELKSIGHDQTFATSVGSLGGLLEIAKSHSAIVARALRSKEQVARTVSVVLRFDDQTGVSRSQTLPFGLDDETAISAIVAALMETVPLKGAVRLVGVHLSNFLERGNNAMQLSFDIDVGSPEGKAKSAQLSQNRQVSMAALRDAVDDVRAKFGNTSLGTLSELGEEGLEIERQRGSHAFGPKQGPQ